LGKHHDLLAIPRHIDKLVAVKSSAVNGDGSAGRDRVGDVAAVVFE
jgi:hypothetical protein